jgi:two-component system chemotaxis response regulator CheB
MAGHDIIVIGASAGGLQALQDLLRELPPNLPAAILIVVHTAPSSSGLLPEILGRGCSLTVSHATDRERIRHGQVYVAPPDHHLLLEKGVIRLTRGPKENGFRPAVDPLFRTAASTFGPRVVGVVLSGGLNDGTQGLFEIKRRNGIAIVQDPQEALFPSMPASAAQNVNVDHILKVSQIAAELISLAGEKPKKGDRRMARANSTGPDIAVVGTRALKTNLRPGPPSRFTCPECGGALWEIKEGKLLRYRCHVGHGYTDDGLMAAQTESVEAALWTALRALEEKAEMRRQMADRAQKQRFHAAATQLRKASQQIEAQAEIIRSVLVSDAPTADDVAEKARNGNGQKNGNGAKRRKRSKAVR